jgi:RsmE family RNA methyltransferase
VQREHDLKPGISIVAAVRGGRLGRFTVRSVSESEICGELSLDHEPPPRVGAELIVAVPRPQTVKKIIHLAVTFGIERLHFVRSLNTVKSYLQSNALTPESIDAEVLRGLAQAVDSCAPSIEVHRSFENFSVNELPQIVGRCGACAFADTLAAPRIGASIFPSGSRFALAIGPESGWSDFERNTFLGAGFRAVSLGVRMLRVEVAAAIGLAELGVVVREAV